VGDPSSAAKSGGALSGMGCLVVQSYVVGGNRSYPDLGRNQRPTVPRIQDFDTAADDAGHVGTTLVESLILGQIGAGGPGNPSPSSPFGFPRYHLQAVVAENA
jgi:hypothetical protein